MGSRCRGSTERQGSGTRSGTGRFVLAGPGSDAPEYAHSFHSTTEGAHRAGSRLRTIARRSVVGRSGKIEAIEEWGCHLDYRESASSPVVALLLHLLLAAAAAHTAPGAGLDSAAYMLLFHATAVLSGTVLLQQGLLLRPMMLGVLAGWVLGSALFSGDIALRAFA